MDIDDHSIGRLAHRTSAELVLHGRKRIIERIHENAAHDIDHQHLMAGTGLIKPSPFARYAGGIVARTQNAVLVIDEGQNLALISPMVAGGDAIDPGAKKLIGHRPSQAEAARGIFGIGDDEIGFQDVFQAGELGRNHVPARPPDDVANEQKSHPGFIAQASAGETVFGPHGYNFCAQAPQHRGRHDGAIPERQE